MHVIICHRCHIVATITFLAPSWLEAGVPGWRSRHPAEWWSEAAFGHCTGADTKARHWEAPSSSQAVAGKGHCGILWDTVGYRGSLRVLTWERRRFRMHHHITCNAESEHLGVIFYAPPRQSCCWMRWDGTEWHRYQLCHVVPALFGAEASVSHVGIPKAPNDP